MDACDSIGRSRRHFHVRCFGRPPFLNCLNLIEASLDLAHETVSENNSFMRISGACPLYYSGACPL